MTHHDFDLSEVLEQLRSDESGDLVAYSDGCCTPVPIGPVQRFRRSCTAARG